jgi:hypothetical protein
VIAAALFVILGILVANLYPGESGVKTRSNDLEIRYMPNVSLGNVRGIHPGRVAWGHNQKIGREVYLLHRMAIRFPVQSP